MNAVHSVPVYRFSISRMNIVLRTLLMSSSVLPLIPFAFAVQNRLSIISPGATLLALLIATVLFVPAHEAMHGLVFRLYGHRVSFGFKPWTSLGPVFYVSSAGSRFSRLQYQLACIAPQLLTPLLLLIATLHVPAVAVIGAAYAATLNLGGGTGDIFVAATLFRFPRDAVVVDAEDGMDVYPLSAS